VLCSARHSDRVGTRRLPRLLAVPLAGSLVLCALIAAAEDTPTKPSASPPPEPAKTAAPVVRSLDDFKRLPPGAILVPCDLKDGLRLVPGGVLLAPDDYQKLLDELAALRARLGPEKPTVPSVCRLSGQVKDNVVHLKGEFEFPTLRPNATVTLGCAQGNAKSVALDGKTPLCTYSREDGYVLSVEKPGDHQATLEVEVPLGSKGAERGLDLDLPRAPITSLDLDLGDPAVKEARLTLPAKEGRPVTQPLPARSVDGRGRVTTLLGALGRLDLAWKGTAPPPGGPPLLSAEGRLTVRVVPNGLLLDLNFTLKPLRGQTAQWRFLLPPRTELIAPRLPDERIAAFEQPDPKNNPMLHVLRLKGSVGDPLDVAFRSFQPRGEGTVPVGPFAVLGALEHTGTLLLTAPADVLVRAQLPDERQAIVSRQEVTEEERRKEPQAVAAFAYRTALPLEAKGPALPVPPPFLLLEVEAVKETCATRTAYALKLTERGWRVTTDIEVTPHLNGGVERLEVQVPPGYEEVRRPGAARPGQHVDWDAASGTVLVTLTPRKTERFHVTLETLYPLPPGEGGVLQPAAHGTLTLPLPRPRKTEDQGGQVSVSLPAGMELVPPQQGDPAWEGLPPGKTEHAWHSVYSPERVAVSWRVPRPDVAADSVADVTLSGRLAQVRQRLVFPTTASNRVLLWVPEALDPDRVRLESGRARPAADDGTPPPKKAGFRAWPVQLAAAVDRDHPLVVTYTFTLPESGPDGRRFSLPLLLPESASRVETLVHVWSEPGARPVLAAGNSWEEVDVVGDRDVLPSLSLRGRRPDRPPGLLVSEPPASPLAAVLVERALVQATVTENGSQSYRVRFLFPHVYATHLDVEFPAPLTGSNLKAGLLAERRGVQVTWQPVDDNGQPAENGRIARLPIPADFARKPLVLELSYQVLPGRTADSGLLQTTLVPPVLRSDVGRFPARFQVHLPANWVPLYREGGLSSEQRWGWRGWLLGPLPALSSADLERWFFSGFESRFGRPAEADEATAETDDTDPATLVCSRPGLAPLRLNHFPQQVWLLLCSLAVLAAGLSVYLLLVAFARRAPAEGTPSGSGTVPAGRLPRALFWPLAVCMGLAIVLASLYWPGILGPVLYGAEPGVLVLAVCLVVQWTLHQRYRRQVVFLPGFARMKPGSSLIRNGSNNAAARPRGEPSTVDAPPPLSNAGQ
jgi:hypothetical protein